MILEVTKLVEMKQIYGTMLIEIRLTQNNDSPFILGDATARSAPLSPAPPTNLVSKLGLNGLDGETTGQIK